MKILDTEIWRKDIMFNAIKFNASGRRKGSVFGVLFLAVVAALLPMSAQAQCAKTWDASGVWEIRQGRGAGTIVRLNLKQSSGALSGTASREVRAGERGSLATKTVTGRAVGDADGSAFYISIDWSDMPGEFVTYKGKILASGRAEGEMFLNGSQTSRASWYSVQPLTCGWSPGKSRGNLTSKLSADAPVKTSEIAATQPKPPFITANQAIVPTPNHPFGIVVLGWDGGPDHPNVEVWLSMDNGTEIPAFSMEQGPQSPVWKQPKATIPLQLQRYHHYKFVLKDAAGKSLSATALVVVP